MGQVKRLHLNAVTKSIADPGHLLAGQIHVEDQPCQAGWRVTQPTAKGVHHALQSGTQGGDKFASRPYYEQGWIRFEESSLLPIRNTTGIGLESFAHSIYPSVCDPKSFSFTHGRGNADSNGGLNSRVVNGHLATRGNRRNVSLYLSPRYIHACTHVCTYIHIYIFSFLEDLFGCVKETLQFSCQRFASIAVSFISGCLTHCYQYTAGKCSVCEMSAKKPKIWPRVGDTVPVFRAGAGVIKSQQTNVEFLKWVYLLEKWYTYIYIRFLGRFDNAMNWNTRKLERSIDFTASSSALFMDVRACVTPPLYIRSTLFRENTQQLCESNRCFSSEENLKRVFGFPPKLHIGGGTKKM